MKQDRIDRLIEITGQIPEAYVAEALPQSVREALRSDGLTEAPEEKKTMKQSIAHYIAGGFAAAAAIGVLVGGGLLISTLNRKPERPGDSGNDTTAVTSLTETTETTTTDGSFVTVTVDNLEFAKYADHAEVIGFVGQPGEGSVTIPAGVGGLYVTRIADAAFRGADALWQVEVSSAVTSIGKEAFSDCAGLIIVTLPESVSEIGEEAFALCPNLEAVTFLNDDVQIAERAFMGCDKKKLVLRGGAGIEEYARANGFDYEPLDGTQPHTDITDADPGASGNYYHFVDGKPVAYTDPEGYKPQIISDGTNYFSTKNNGLYRRDNDQLIMAVENPQQYLITDDAKGKAPLVDYRNIVEVGDKWYFVVADIDYEYMDDLNGKADFHVETELMFWVNRQTGKTEICPAPTSDLYDVLKGTEGYDPRNYGRGDPNEKYEIGTFGWKADPDGDAVFAMDYIPELVIRMPVPGAGRYKAWYIGNNYESAAFVDSDGLFVPLGNGKILINTAWYGLYELNIADGSMKEIIRDISVCDLCNVHGRIFGTEFDGGLFEYIPETGTTKTIEEFINHEVFLWDYSADAIIISISDYDSESRETSYLLYSLTDGKFTELKP